MPSTCSIQPTCGQYGPGKYKRAKLGQIEAHFANFWTRPRLVIVARDWGKIKGSRTLSFPSQKGEVTFREPLARITPMTFEGYSTFRRNRFQDNAKAATSMAWGGDSSSPFIINHQGRLIMLYLWILMCLSLAFAFMSN